MLGGGTRRGRRTDNGERPQIAAAGRLDERARRHDEAADFWLSHGDPERADLERCNAEGHRMAADIHLRRPALALADSRARGSTAAKRAHPAPFVPAREGYRRARRWPSRS